MNLRFQLFFAFCAVALTGTANADVEPFFKEHCLRCHGEEKQKGDFRIDELSRDFSSGKDAEMWFEVITRMGAGEMPPDDEPSLPTAAESDRVMEWLTQQIKEGEAARAAAGPPVAHYRLSREEYAHTVYDLLGVKYDTRAPGAFTEDPDWHGFERIGSELSLSPSHIEKYLTAARQIIDQAFPDEEVRYTKSRRDALDIDWNNREKREYLEKIGVVKHIRTMLWPGHQLGYLRPDAGYRQAPGIYRARLQVSGVTPKGGRPPHLELWSKKLDRMIFEADVLAPEGKPTILEFESFIPGGTLDVTLSNVVPGPSNAGRSGRPGPRVFTSFADPLSRMPWQRKMTDDEGNPLFPMLIFDWIEWEGPIDKPQDIAKREGFFPPENSDEFTTRAHLKRFAEAAWRRPIEGAELDRYLAIYQKQRDAGADFRAAYKAGMLGIMASKNFTYLAQGSAEEKRKHLTDIELASRLSYFLWSSKPDAELMRVATAGKLSDPQILREQFQRMISDPKIDRFTQSFPAQWLHLKKVGMFPPDKKLYPDYDKWLEQSMILETTGYFAEVFAKNLPIREFLDSDWTMLNPRLANHYDLPIPETAGFQRVTLPAENQRGGILTHGSVLSLTSDGTRHRPVHRGIWVSEAIFGKTPPPPPPNVDAIQPNPIDEPKATVRMKLAAHIENPNCAACHAKIDPLGFAFENFDAIGRWRTEEVVPKGTGKDPMVDASGSLPDGREFGDASEFRKFIAADTDPFAAAFTKKLATYALRRAMTVDDAELLDAMVRESRKDDFRLRDLIENFVTSPLFLNR